MSGSNSEPTKLVITCKCGKRLRLTGAEPGRVGSCPDCGARFQVGERKGSAPEPGEEAREAKPSTQREKPRSRTGRLEAAPEAGGYALSADGDEPVAPFRKGAFESRMAGQRGREADAPQMVRGGASAPRTAVDAIGRGGILPLPKSAEKSWVGSLKYPLWDGTGVAVLLLMPPALAVVSLVVFAALPLVQKGGENLLLGPILCGFIPVFGVVLGWLLAVFSAVLITSTRGDVHHPRWPHFDLGEIATTWGRWLAAWLPGLVPAFAAALAVFPPNADATLAQRIGFWEIVVLGGVYGMTVLVATTLHDDVMAALPHLVVPAIWKLGTLLVVPLALLGAIAGWIVVAEAVLRRLAGQGPIVLLGGAWVAWVVVVYLGLVAMRVLGRGYRRRQKKIAWFATKRVRRELPVESAPTSFAPEI